MYSAVANSWLNFGQQICLNSDNSNGVVIKSEIECQPEPETVAKDITYGNVGDYKALIFSLTTGDGLGVGANLKISYNNNEEIEQKFRKLLEAWELNTPMIGKYEAGVLGVLASIKWYVFFSWLFSVSIVIISGVFFANDFLLIGIGSVLLLANSVTLMACLIKYKGNSHDKCVK